MGINKQKEDDDNFFISIIALFKWTKIFLAPVFLFGIIGGAITIKNENTTYEYLGIGLIILGIVLGILLAEYIRKKHGLIEFDARDEATPDIDKWLEEEREKLKKK